MDDHLKAAADAAAITDIELIKAWTRVRNQDELSCHDVAVQDELDRREIEI